MDTPLTAKLAARELVVRRNRRVILDIPRMEIAPGEVLGMIGPNGAGKSTLLLHLALLQRPDAGEVLFEGAPTHGRELELRRRMAVVFQDPLLLDRSVRANVETGMQLRGIRQGERQARAEAWLARFGIASLAGRSPRTISGGEAQRTSLARAFTLQPEVLFLDEPFSALDQPTREVLMDDLASVLRETRTTALLVTHDRDEAARLSDRIAVLLAGRIRQIGAPAEVLGAPVDEEVAAFVGAETAILGRVVERGEGLVTLEAGGHFIEALATGIFEQALVCLRPEDVSLLVGEGPSGSARNHLPGIVRRLTLAGADARVEVDCGFRLMARITRRSAEELALQPGSTVVATFKATAVHLIPR